MRERYRSLLAGSKEEANSEEEEEGDADITFIPGLKKGLSKALEEKEREKEKEQEEQSLSVYDQYRRRLREKRKEKGKATKEEEEKEEELFADLGEKKNKKNKKNKKDKKAKDEQEAKSNAELELLMIDETGAKNEDFDMHEMKQNLKKKGKKREAVKEDDFQVAEVRGCDP